MSSKIPGLIAPIFEEDLDSPIELPFTFYASVTEAGVLLYKGQHMEFVVAPDGPATDPVAGDRVRCLFVRASQQLVVVELVS